MRGRTRDRMVYLAAHPLLFGVLAATRGRAVRRLGRTVLVHGRDEYAEVLTRVPLDRTAEGTTGGAAGRLLEGDGALFDQEGMEHRRTRRDTMTALGSAGVARLRPIWTDVLERRLKPLRDGNPVDLVPVAAELSGATAAALLGLDVDPLALAGAARHAGATAARAHLPGLARRGAHRTSEEAAARLSTLITGARRPGAGPAHAERADGAGPAHAQGERGAGVGDGERAGAGIAAMLAVAAINTTVAGLPRIAAWAADDDLWPHAEDRPQVLADELLRVTTPTPLLPRVAAAGATAGGCPIRGGDRLMLIARHAVAAHTDDPDPLAPAAAQVSRLVFGTGAHACPGATLARAQTADFLAALAPHRPVVVRARPDRRSALPGWRSLVVTCGSR